jgi:hypothetical protein
MLHHSNLAMAIREPVIVFTLITALSAGLLAAWWLFPLGLLLAGLMILRIVTSPTAKLNDRIQSRASLSHSFQEKFRRIESFELRLYNATAGASAEEQRRLRPILENVTELVDQTYAFLAQMATLHNFVSEGTSQHDLKYEMNQEKLNLDLMIETCQDPEKLAQYKQDLAALEYRRQNIKEVRSALDSVDNELRQIEQALNTVLAETIMMQGRSTKDTKEKFNAVLAMIDKEKQDLAQFHNQRF